MEEAPVTAATGALGPVITKLAALLGSEYKLRWRTRRDLKSIRSKLKPVHSILWNIWEREELDEASKALKMEALDLADDVDDAIVDFILTMERSISNNKRLVQTKIKVSPFHDFKKRASNVFGRCRSKWKKPFSSILSCGKTDTGTFVLASFEHIRLSARMHRSLWVCPDQGTSSSNTSSEEDETTPVELNLKIATIYGIAGMGKSTLADLVYGAIGDKFQSRAFVPVARPGGNMTEVLAGILQQVAPNSSVPLVGAEAAYEEEDFIAMISNFLKDKRYLVIIDDIWSWREWEVIIKSLPDNNLGSRIVRTTRINAVAEKWRGDDSLGSNALLHEMVPQWYGWEGWVYPSGTELDIARQMVAKKAYLVAEDFEAEHSLVRMCGGTPLAVRCMLSAVAQELKKQGLHAKAYDVQYEIVEHIKESGIQNTPGFEPLVESLQLGFDNLPHHMLKTCLLYCSIYPEGHTFERGDLVRRWISERFVYNEEEANSYFEELVNRGFILHSRMHPMMHNFLRWKSCQDGFTTCSSEITGSYNTSRIRRLCICRASGDLSALDWNLIRSLLVYDDIKKVPFETLAGVRVLDLCDIEGLQDHHLKDICGLVRLRHLLGLFGDGISELPPEIVSLQCLETFHARGRGLERLPGFIGNLQQLKTLELRAIALPREIGALQKLHNLRIKDTFITELPSGIGSLQQLENLDISFTWVWKLPKEIGSLQKLKTLDISHTRITVLPKEIGKLHRLEHLLMSGTKVANIPREISGLKELKSLKLDKSFAAVPLEVCAFVELPDFLQQALKKTDLVDDLAREMISFQPNPVARTDGGIAVGATQMHIPLWIKEHFNDITVLDIRICKLEEEGQEILREMPRLEELKLRFEVVPREPVVISSQGFPVLLILTVDSRVPRVSFQAGAMPKLQCLIFKFKFYAGPPNKGPVGVNHLNSLRKIRFECNEDRYRRDSPCIRPTIDVVKKEAEKLSRLSHVEVCGQKEEIICKGEPRHMDETIPWKRILYAQTSQKEAGETSGYGGSGEIEEDNQA